MRGLCSSNPLCFSVIYLGRSRLSPTIRFPNSRIRRIMHPGFCPVCCNIFDQVDCVPCRITCGKQFRAYLIYFSLKCFFHSQGHVACQRCCDTLMKSRQCCPFRCDMAILRSRHIRPMAMSLVNAGGSPGGDLIKSYVPLLRWLADSYTCSSKITAVWSTIRQEELRYNQVISTLHALRVDILAQRGALQMRAHRTRDALAERYDLLRQLGRARKELEAETVTQGCLRDELTLLKRNVRLLIDYFPWRFLILSEFLSETRDR